MWFSAFSGARSVAAVALLVALVALFVAAAAPARAATAPAAAYARALARLDDALRFAIERQPEGLAKSLAASERVCGLGQEADGVGDAAAAAEDWGTLGQLVVKLDEPGLVRVEAAFAEVDRTLSQLQSRFRRAWRQEPARVAQLHRGARTLRRGLARLSAGFHHLSGAFAAWRQHRCEAALASVDSFSRSIPGAVGAVNLGMWQLFALAEPVSSAPQGSRRQSADAAGGPAAKNRLR